MKRLPDQLRVSRAAENRWSRAETVTLIGPAVLAVLLAVALVLIQNHAASVPPERGSGPSVGYSSLSGVMILCIGLLTAWGVTAYYRCSDETIRRYLVLSATLMVAWLIMVMVKYRAVSLLFTEYTWYAFYIPILSLPLLSLYGLLRTSALDQRARVRTAKRVALAVSLVLMAFVFTNGLHHAVFVFDPSSETFSRDYTYGPGYWVVVAWAVLLLAGGWVLLLWSARRQLRTASLLLALIVLVGIVYAILYITRIHVVFTSNLALTFVLLFTLVTELSLRMGLLPSYAWDREAFTTLPLDLRVLTRERVPVYRTSYARPLHAAVIDELSRIDFPLREMASPELSAPRSGTPHHSVLSFGTRDDPTTVYRAYSVRGGMALLASDVSGINRQRRILEGKQEQLRRQNALLERTHMVQSRLRRQRHEQVFLAEVEESLSSVMHQIRERLASLPRGDSPGELAARKRILISIKLLVSYSKAKGSLILAEKENSFIDRDRLHLLLAQSITDLAVVGVDGAVNMVVDRGLPLRAASILYDCFYDFATASIDCTHPVLMVYLSDRDPHAIELRIAHACEGGRLDEYAPPAALLGTLDAHGVHLDVDGEPGSVTLRVSIPHEVRTP